ncbi:MAG TPA: HYR domain-containing protein, partial [Saprospiraceae bacterium]|nr:HYR domain-containing protein [Saprospiraceae bacterium]
MFIRPLAVVLGVCLASLCLGLSTADTDTGTPDFSQNQPTKLWTWPVPYQMVQQRMGRTEVIVDFSFCTDAYVSGLPGLLASPYGSEVAIPVSFSGSTIDGDQWSPPENCNENLDSKESNFSLHYFTVDQSGLYSFTGQFDDWSGRIALYQGPFNPDQPFNNCYVFSQREMGSGDALISSANLAECSSYALVVTGDSLPEFGNYDVSYSGPGLAIAPETGECLGHNSGLYGETRWYDQEEGGNLLYAGNSFNPVREEFIDPMMDGSYTYYVAFFSEGEESQRYIASVDAGDCSVSITDPCSCRNNASNSVNGQFNEVIEVEAPSGQTWTLLNNIGLFEPISPNSLQSDALIQAGTILTESPMSGGLSLYSLEGVHTDALGYSVDVTNGSTVLSQSNTCHYPNPMIINLPNQTCTQSPEFTLQGSADQPGSGSFTIDGVATDLFDPAALGVGRVEVVYTFDADGNPGPGVTEPGCIQSVRQQVDITDDPLTACRNNINVSLGTNCNAQITTNMLLTNDPCMVSGSFTLQVMTLDSVLVPNNVITEVGTYMGEVISNSSGNRCWGYIHAEDKIAPIIFCPDDVIIDCQDSIDPANTGMPTADDNCSDTRFEYTDSLALDNCSTGDIFRTWIVFDAFDNSDTCVQRISLIDNQPVIIDWPDDLTLDCPQDQISLHPDSLPGRFGKPIYSSNCRDLADNYRDQIYDICSPASFKIHREWKIRDWCDPDTLWEHTQIIKVLDTVPPNITCPGDLTLQVQHNECEVSLSNYRPIVSDACDPDPSFSIRVFDEFGLIADPDLLTPGTYDVEFTASDACGNESYCRTTVEVQDLIAPVPICDQNTNLTLTNDGWADLCYTVIDDQSTDNCRVRELLIKREGEPDSLYRECITFRCEDIGLNKVHLRVEDIYGNTNSCWANVYVEDKKDPGIICPDDVTVNCDVDLSDPLNTGGLPVVLDNCDSLQPTFTDEKDYSSCATGIVTRTWRVEKILVGQDGLPGTADDVIKSAECEQIITVVDTTEVDIQWPNDLTILCTGNAISLVPGDLHIYNRQDTIYDRPIVSGEDCEHLGISFDD